MKKTIAMILTVILCFGLVSTVFALETKADDQTWELSVNLSFSENSGKAVKEACDRITEATNGKVTFNLYYSWSLVAVPDAVRSCQGGLVDIIIAPSQMYPSIFVRTGSLMALPMIQLPGMVEATEIFLDLYNKNESMQSEIDGNGLHLWTVSYTAPQNIHLTADKAITTPEELKGHKIICDTTEIQNLISDNQGAPVTASGPEYYSNISNGVADGVVQHYNALFAFGVAPDLINSTTKFGESGLYMTSVFYMINQDVWNSFPDDIKAAFEAEADQLRIDQTNNDKALSDMVFGQMAEKGADIVELDDEQLAVWADALAPYREAKLQEMKDLGANDIDDLYSQLLDAIASYTE